LRRKPDETNFAAVAAAKNLSTAVVNNDVVVADEAVKIEGTRVILRNAHQTDP